MTTSARSTRPVVRLTTPGEIVGAVPHLCGFVPSESLVVISLRGERARVGLTMRFDLPRSADHVVTVEEQLASDAAGRLAVDGARRAVVVIYTADADDEGVLPRRHLVDALRAHCQQRGIAIDDVLLVRDQRWMSYVCRDRRCCPADGTPLAAAAASPALGLVAAQQAVDGRAVLDSRDELAASIAAPQLLARRAALEALSVAQEARAQDRARRGRAAVNADALDRWRAAVRRFAEPPAQLSDGEAATLAVAVDDVFVRDEVATWALRDCSAVLAALHELARRTPPPHDAPVCTLLAWVAYAEGNGGLANVALERVAVSRPDYHLAVLLRQALDGQVPPSRVRALLRATSADLRRRRARRR